MGKQTIIDKRAYIINQARRLPIDTRQSIVDAILESIKNDEGRIRAVDRLAQLIPIGEEIFNCTYNPKTKSNGDALIRNMCAKVMRVEGYTFPAIAKAMNRHPSSVIVMVRRAEEMDAGFFGREYQDKYKDFIKRI